MGETIKKIFTPDYSTLIFLLFVMGLFGIVLCWRIRKVGKAMNEYIEETEEQIKDLNEKHIKSLEEHIESLNKVKASFNKLIAAEEKYTSFYKRLSEFHDRKIEYLYRIIDLYEKKAELAELADDDEQINDVYKELIKEDDLIIEFLDEYKNRNLDKK